MAVAEKSNPPPRLWLACLRLGLALAISTSCTTTAVFRRYAGPPLPRQQVALLSSYNSHRQELIRLDGEPLGVPGETAERFQIELLPGRHVVDATEPYNHAVCAPAVEFFAEPGKDYWINFSPVGLLGVYRLRVYETKADSDAVIRLASVPADCRRSQCECPP